MEKGRTNGILAQRIFCSFHYFLQGNFLGASLKENHDFCYSRHFICFILRQRFIILRGFVVVLDAILVILQSSPVLQSTYVSGRWPAQLAIYLFVQHRRFAVCCSYLLPRPLVACFENCNWDSISCKRFTNRSFTWLLACGHYTSLNFERFHSTKHILKK